MNKYICFLKHFVLCITAFAAVFCFSEAGPARASEIPLLSVDKMKDRAVLLEYAVRISEEVHRVRGLEAGRDFSVEFMSVPDFAYYRYLRDREGRDEAFANALRLFLSGFGADEGDWTDPDVAAIAGARTVQGLYEPDGPHIIITGNASELLPLAASLLEIARGDRKTARKTMNGIAELLGDEKGAKALAARQTLFHELVHAGQDRLSGLRGLEAAARSEFDFFLACRALLEGDAAFSSFVYLGDFLGMGKITTETGRAGQGGAERAATSAVAPISLFDDPLGIFYSRITGFPYSAGYAYAASLYGSGGFGALDAALGNPPATSRQILHPATDAGGDFDVAVCDFGPSPVFKSSTRLAGLLNDDNIAVDTTLGEAGINALLDSFGIYSFDEEPAAGWAGDRIRMYSDGRLRIAAFWLLSWETEAAAKRFYAAYRDVIARKCADDPGAAAPGRKPLKADNLCGTQFMKYVDGKVLIAELPWQLDGGELEEIESFIDSVEFETMTASELSARLAEKYLVEK